MSAYLIGKLTVTDPSWLPEYSERVQKQLADVGATYHVRGTNLELLEGDCPMPSAAIVIEFPSMDIARDWYNSPEYGELIELRRTGSTLELFLAEGV